MARAIPDEEIRSFKALAQELVMITCNLIENLSRPTGKFLQDCITCELSYINTNHPDFLASQEFKNSVDTQRQFAGLAVNSNDPFAQPQPGAMGPGVGGMPGQMGPGG